MFCAGFITLIASPAFARSMSMKEGGCSLDLLHHWRDCYPPSIYPGGDPVLQLYWDNDDYGFQEREGCKGGSLLAGS